MKRKYQKKKMAKKLENKMALMNLVAVIVLLFQIIKI